MSDSISPKLYLVHVGFYDEVTSFGGVYEGHTNIFLVSDSAQNARTKAKSLEIFKSKRMHIDGIQEIKAVDGYQISVIKDEASSDATEINPYIFRDLGPVKND